MAVTEKSFTAEADAWVRETEERMLAVFRHSVQLLDREMLATIGEGGNMPIDTGFLRASRMASTEGPAIMREDAVPVPGRAYPPNDGQIVTLLTNLKIGQSVWLTFVAAYARRQEYGFNGQDALGRTYKQAGRGFVRLAAQSWAAIVATATVMAQGAVAASK
jgi:hypothetical protein